MNKESHAYACEMGGVFFSKVASRLTLEELIYWIREHEELLSLLKKKEPVLIGHSSDRFIINTAIAKDTAKVFNSQSPFRKPMTSNVITNFLQPHYVEKPMTDSACWYPLFCSLFPSEIITVLGGEDAMAHVHFSPQQIRLLAQKQNSADKTDGPLSFDVHNYFPIIGSKGETVFLTLKWDPKHPSYKKNQWDFYFPHAQFGNEKLLHKNGRLFMC